MTDYATCQTIATPLRRFAGALAVGALMLLSLVPNTATAQAKTPANAAAPGTPVASVATIAPGMTRDQVVALLGQPLSTRSFQQFTYLLYKNGCEKTCGMNDLVVLDSGQVVDAVFRSPKRHYTGTSSSPKMIPPAEARRGTTTAPHPVTVKPPQ